MKSKILIIEDEEKFARFVEMELTYEGYQVQKAFNGREGLEMAENNDYDLVLLDVMLPGLNGMEVLRRLRRSTSLPVIMLTARDSVMDKVSGLDSGADDYITKPFAIEELLARIRTVLRKQPKEKNHELLKVGKLSLDPKSRQVKVGANLVELTKREFELLHYLLENKGVVLSRDTLLENVWGYDFEGETNTVDVYIRFLRSKLDEVFDLKIITTIRGVGYVIREEE